MEKHGTDAQHKTEERDGMIVEWDVPIDMDDGVVLRADVFRPSDDDRYPVILSYGAFGKGLAFQEGNPSAWGRMTGGYPETAQGTSNKYANWEVVDPEKWVPDGYICIRVDARGSGRSPGYLDPWSKGEAIDIHDCVEWAAIQPWSSGKIGMNGISYYAINQWHVASLAPPHLAACCIWEGSQDFYREQIRHGGIYSQFSENLYPRAFHRAQHGLGERGHKSLATGEPVSGPDTLSEEELAANRIDIERWSLDRTLISGDFAKRSGHLDKVKVPFLSAANWGGHGLHCRGNFEGFLAAQSESKWLEAHGDAHWTHFYTDYGVALQKRFFGYFLKGEDTGWDTQPRVQLNIRHPGEKFVLRAEHEWPLARTQWTRYYLDPASMSLGPSEPVQTDPVTYDALGHGLLFKTPPLDAPLEITGPSAVRLTLSSETSDADVFLVLRLFDPMGKEVTFIGANDPQTPVAQGWLRASHRKLDPERSLPYRPYHTHDETWPLDPNDPVDLDVEIWPTSIVVPQGYVLGLHLRGCDYASDAGPLDLPGVKYTLTGVGPFLHEHPEDRPPEIFHKRYTLHFEKGERPYVLLPIIPPG